MIPQRTLLTYLYGNSLPFPPVSHAILGDGLILIPLSNNVALFITPMKLMLAILNEGYIDCGIYHIDYVVKREMWPIVEDFYWPAHMSLI